MKKLFVMASAMVLLAAGTVWAGPHKHGKKSDHHYQVHHNAKRPGPASGRQPGAFAHHKTGAHQNQK